LLLLLHSSALSTDKSVVVLYAHLERNSRMVFVSSHQESHVHHQVESLLVTLELTMPSNLASVL
jgi:hypothetical protein